MPDYMDFDEVMDALQVDANELKRMIKEGELAAFKDGNLVKFKASDIDAKRQGIETEPTIILPADAGDDDEDDLEVDDEELEFGGDEEEIEVDIADSADMSMEEVPTIDMSDESQNVTEEIEFESEGDFAFSEDETVVTQEVGADDTLMEDDEDEYEEAGMQTEALRFTDEIDSEDEEYYDDEDEGRPRRRGRAMAPVIEESTSIGVMISLVIVFFIMLFSVFVWLEAVRESKSSWVDFLIPAIITEPIGVVQMDLDQQDYTKPTGVVADTGAWFEDFFYGPPKTIQISKDIGINPENVAGGDDDGGDDDDDGGLDDDDDGGLDDDDDGGLDDDDDGGLDDDDDGGLDDDDDGGLDDDDDGLDDDDDDGD
ncbi:helix-turn-helix domain-containing protein [Planctomycetota bacterium]